MCSSVRAPRSAGIDPERLELLPHPSGPDAEDEAALAQDVERGHLGGEVHGIAVGQDEHARAEPDALGHARDHARA